MRFLKNREKIIKFDRNILDEYYIKDKMDPWYYLDLTSSLTDSSGEEIELTEISNESYDGSWSLNCAGYNGCITFKNKNYQQITFNNITKELHCNDNDNTDTYILTIQ